MPAQPLPAQPMPAQPLLAIGPTGPGRAPDLRADPGPVGALVRAVAALAAQHPAELPGPVALAQTAVLLQQLEVLRVIALGRLADVDTRQLHHLHGAPSTASWVDRQGVPGLDRGQVALARKLRALPATAEQITAGRLSLAAGQLIGTALAKVRPHLDRPDGQLDGHPQQHALRNVLVEGIAMLTAQALGGAPANDPDHHALRTLMGQLADAPLSAADRLEAGFVHLAQHLEPALLRAALDLLVDALLPNQHAKRARDAHHQRGFGLTLNHDKTGWQLTHHQLDLTLGELLWTVMHAGMTTDPDNPLDTAAHQPPNQGDGNGHTPRTKSQRQHDGLAHALRQTLDDSKLGSRDKTAPHIAITVTLDALHHTPGALPARTNSGAHWPTELVHRTLCDSRLTRLILNLAGRVQQVSHSQRTLKPHERLALHTQWGGQCAAAGCTRGPGHRLTPHHATPWWKTKTTSLPDTIPVCPSTHHDLHEGHKTIQLKDGRWLNHNGWTQPP